MLGEQTATVDYGRPEDEYASENAKRFTVDSLLQIRRPDATCKPLPATGATYDGGKYWRRL